MSFPAIQNLSHEVAVLTGANRGLGASFLKELLSRGIKKVYALARQPEQIQTADPRVVKLAFDITDADRAMLLAAQVSDATILFNNAGALSFGGLLSAPLDDIRKDFAVNFYGSLNVVRALAPVLESNKGGIVSVLSLVSLASAPGIPGYSASKAAEYSLTQALRVELRGKVRIYNAFPGGIDTDMLKGVDAHKAAPAAVAKAILDGVQTGQEDIFPEVQSMGELFLKDPKTFERTMAGV